MTTSQLPPCPLPDCKGGEHHYHNRYLHEVENSACKKSSSFHTSCYGPHQPQQQWHPIECDQIKAGMRIRATTVLGDVVATRTGVAHHTNRSGDWRTEGGWWLNGWGDPTTYEVDPATIPADPDAELIGTVAEALAGVTITDPDFNGLEREDWRKLAEAAIKACPAHNEAGEQA